MLVLWRFKHLRSFKRDTMKTDVFKSCLVWLIMYLRFCQWLWFFGIDHSLAVLAGTKIMRITVENYMSSVVKAYGWWNCKQSLLQTTFCAREKRCSIYILLICTPKWLRSSRSEELVTLWFFLFVRIGESLISFWLLFFLRISLEYVRNHLLRIPLIDWR